MKRCVSRCLAGREACSHKWAPWSRSQLLALSMFWLVALRAFSAEALLIDIDATLHEATISPLLVFLPAGTYSVTPVGIAGGGAFDAWNPWGNTTCIQPSGCAMTIPTIFTGWRNAYDVISDAITAVSVNGSPLSPVGAEPGGIAQLQDYWVASGSETDRYHVDDTTVYPTPPDALAGAESSLFTVSADGLVGFAIRNGEPGDNLGGMSLEITLVPEPDTAALLALGLASLGLRRRSRP